MNLVRRLKMNGLFVSSIENAALDAFISHLDPSIEPIIVGQSLPYHIDANGWEGVIIEAEGKRVQTSLLLSVLATNALLALVTARRMCEPPIDLSILSALKGVKGRMERVPNDLGIIACIDFAHTPDSYENSSPSSKSIRQGAYRRRGRGDATAASGRPWRIACAGGPHHHRGSEGEDERRCSRPARVEEGHGYHHHPRRQRHRRAVREQAQAMSSSFEQGLSLHPAAEDHRLG